MLLNILFLTLASFGSLLAAAGPLKARASFTVQVGQDGFTYSPNSVNASAGDTIDFVFPSAVPHTVSSSQSFNEPCVISTASNVTNLQAPGGGTVSFTVASSGSQWFHCATPGHCQSGMVFAINPGPPGSAQSIYNFIALAEGKSISTAGPASTNAAQTSVVTTAGAAAATTGSTSDASRMVFFGGRDVAMVLGMAGFIALFV